VGKRACADQRRWGADNAAAAWRVCRSTPLGESRPPPTTALRTAHGMLAAPKHTALISLCCADERQGPCVRAHQTLSVAPCIDVTCTLVAVGSEVSTASTAGSCRHASVRRL
jgi:hypothetical protein